MTLEYPGDSAHLHGLESGTFLDDASVSWKSLNPTVADVTSNGSIIARAVGVAAIVATYGAMTSSVTVRVTQSARAKPANPPVAAQLMTLDTVRVPFAGKFTFALSGAGTAPIRYTASAGTITTGGVYTAPSTATTARIVATDAKGATDTAVAIVSGTKFGVASDMMWSRDASFRRAKINQLASVRAQVARVELLWAYIEYTKGRPDWTTPDSVINGLNAAGIEPLVVIDGSPVWANGTAESVDCGYLYVPTSDAAFKTWVTGYALFIKQAATRYRGKVHMWEIGNEANDPGFWRPKIDVVRYGQWFTAIDTTIRRVDATNKTALGGLTALPVWYGSDGLSGTAFLQALYDAGIKPMNIAIHPYSNASQSPEEHIAGAQNFDDIALIHDQMMRNGQGSAGLWVTEWGWNTKTLSEANQATFLKSSLNLIATRYPYVSVVTVFTQYDSNMASYGMLRADGTAKASADVFRTFMAK